MSERQSTLPNPRIKDLTGQVFGRLTVLSFAGIVKRRATWTCKCTCGNDRVAVSNSLVNGHIQSCGCYKIEMMSKANITHGMTNTSEYDIWCGMIKRCNNTNSKSFNRYGGRGIKVCERWMSFENFFNDMGNRPSHDYSIERIDYDGNYEPSNCKWIPKSEQSKNRRINHKIDVNGQVMSLTDAAKAHGLTYSIVWSRIGHLGWTIERALNTPKQQ